MSPNPFRTDGDRIHVIDTLESLDPNLGTPAVLPPTAAREQRRAVSQKGSGKIYYLLLRSSGPNGQFVGAQVEIDDTLRYDFLTMVGLNTRGASSFQERLPWLMRFDTLANEFTMVWTPVQALSYKKEYKLYLVNTGPGNAQVDELEVHRLLLDCD